MPIEDVLSVWWFCSVWAALAIGSERGRTLYGGILGLFLGPFGLLAACLLQRSPKAEAKYQLTVERERRRQTNGGK